MPMFVGNTVINCHLAGDYDGGWPGYESMLA
jgi:hypothetical protein